MGTDAFCYTFGLVTDVVTKLPIRPLDCSKTGMGKCVEEGKQARGKLRGHTSLRLRCELVRELSWGSHVVGSP